MKLRKDIDFFGHRKIYFGISIVLIVASMIMAIIFGVKVDIKFTGGTIATYGYVGELDLNAVKTTTKEQTGFDVTVNSSSSLANDEKTFAVNFSSKDGLLLEAQDALTQKLETTFPDNQIEVITINSVSATMGQDFMVKCLIAVFASFLLMILYITFRFRKIGGLSAGVCGVIALFHDVLIVFATFVIFRLPIDDNFMAVVLFILGYSINDTIVIFDRIRENEKLYGKTMELPVLFNKSINQTLTRTLNTSISTLIAMGAVCVFALIFRVNNIVTFAFPMVIGLVCGSYSSICIAGPLWTTWKSRKKTGKTAQHKHAK